MEIELAVRDIFISWREMIVHFFPHSFTNYPSSHPEGPTPACHGLPPPDLLDRGGHTLHTGGNIQPSERQNSPSDISSTDIPFFFKLRLTKQSGRSRSPTLRWDSVIAGLTGGAPCCRGPIASHRNQISCRCS